MKPNPRFLAAVCCLVIVLALSCKKDTSKKTTCSSTLYGYKGSWSTAGSTFGIISGSAGTFTGIGSIVATTYSNEAAYNTFDHCYYVFQHGEGSLLVNKINSSGAVTTYANASGSAVRYDGMVYNPVTNKMYAIKISTTSNIVELAFSGSTFTETIVASTVGFHGSVSPATASVDVTTGDIYFEFTNFFPNTYSIEKYLPGASAATLVASGTDAQILGLKFNKNDHMLYAVRESAITSASEFIKINPATGSITTLSTVGGVNNEFYTSAYDACSDRYVLSTMIDTSSSWYRVLNMSGAVVFQDTLPQLYQGFDIGY